ncbi:common central domain of tyrosinase-domain-containing protein [Apiosordaria backusii]|uniref:tyrosinase n=1 Tax=Apiosordaria backusii TaxID=314023 RepID=A0AA40AMQ6_9PEZI|nr:common central domain of tyrosinase-domain-containing protein [Apiosordaria backusii]
MNLPIISPVYPVTGIKAGVTDATVPLRLEVDTWYPGQTAEHLFQNNLFIWALRFLQERDPDHKLSFFQIAGIHGMPYQPWDEDTDAITANEGYCTHDSLLFPSWHRPYMLLYEQVLYEIMIKQVIPQLPADKQQEWKDAAATWRLPYWDWAQKKTREGQDQPLYDVPLITKQPRIGVIDLKDGVTVFYIDNPMYKFTMPDNERMGCFGINDIQDTDSKNNIMTIPFSKAQATSRWATYEPESDTVSTQWTEGTVRNSLITSTLNAHPWYGKNIDNVPLAEMVYRLYVHDYISSYTQFATTKFRTSPDYDPGSPAAYLNLEYVHNNIHNWTGGFDKYIGHMAEPAVAAYDPIFWMHHANVDRQFALWQGISLLDPAKNWFQSPDEQLQDDGNWYIATGDLGYAYPELQPWLDKYKDAHGNFDATLYVADVKAQIKALYSPGELGAPTEISSSIPRSLSGTTVAQPNFNKDIIINVTYNRFALNGIPYTLYFFLGTPFPSPSHSDPLQTHPQHIGFVYTFSNPIYRNRAAPVAATAAAKPSPIPNPALKSPSPARSSPATPPFTTAICRRVFMRCLVWRLILSGSIWRSICTGRFALGNDIDIPVENPFVEVAVYHRNAKFDDVGNTAQYQRVERATRSKPGGWRSETA